MDNQHRHISGYRELTHTDIELINRIKSKGEELGALVAELHNDPHADPRWIAIGKTDLQTGIMALVRAVANPTTF